MKPFERQLLPRIEQIQIFNFKDLNVLSYQDKTLCRVSSYLSFESLDTRRPLRNQRNNVCFNTSKQKSLCTATMKPNLVSFDSDVAGRTRIALFTGG